MQEPHVIADILELTQVVRGDHRCQVPLLDVVCEEALHGLPHHRIEAVEGLITEKIIRAGADAEQHRKLLLHALRKGLDLPASVELEALQEPAEAVRIKIRVDPLVKCLHIVRCTVSEKIWLIRDIEASRLHPYILENRLPIEGDRAFIRLQDPCRHPEEGALPGTVRADQTEHRAVLNLRMDMIHCGHALKALGQIVRL